MGTGQERPGGPGEEEAGWGCSAGLFGSSAGWEDHESWMSPESSERALNLGEPWGHPKDGELGARRKGARETGGETEV